MLPINVTVSVTNLCNSKCSTCFIWRFYLDRPHLKNSEFTSEEFRQAFRSLGEAPFWITISGGEPFLRSDLPGICEAASKYCKPAVITIPTNGLLPDSIEDSSRAILQRIGDTELLVNLSLDGIETRHDKIRGVPGNFKRVVQTYDRLNALKREHGNLKIGIHTVVSKFNVNELSEIYGFSKKLAPDNYITEIAEERTELFNQGRNITPNPDQYSTAIRDLLFHMRQEALHARSPIARARHAFRLSYYEIVERLLREKRQIVPCYASFASCHITPFGDVWPCCVLGYDSVIGNLRDYGYDFRKLWFSEKADEIRKYVKDGRCACPLANAHYTSMLCDFPTLARVMADLW